MKKFEFTEGIDKIYSFIFVDFDFIKIYQLRNIH